MHESISDPDERARQFAAIRDHARQAVIGLARGRGAELTTRAMFPRSELTARDLEPLDGARAAREAGHSWDQIGQALGITPDADAGHAGPAVAEAAYTYAAGRPDTETAIRYGRSFVWRCPSCDQTIGDRGLINGPADDEPGHSGDCARLAAAVAEWDASWEAEP